MKALAVGILILCTFAASAQKQIDHVDSIALANKNRLQSKLDSLAAKVKADSIAKATLNLLSIKNVPGLAKVDSLKDANIARINHVKDSINRFVQSKTSFIDSIQMRLVNPGTGQMSNFNLNVQKPTVPNTQIPNVEVPKANIPSINPSKELNTPQLTVPKSDALNDVRQKVNEVKQLPNEKLNDTGLMKEVTELKGKVGKLQGATGKIEEYSKEIQKVKEGDLSKAKTISQDAENLATQNVAELKELQKETKQITAGKNVIEQYKEMAMKMNKEEALNHGKDLLQKEVVDHLTPNIEKLKTGVGQLDKLKKKYGNIADSRYLPKRVPSELKGKSFIERMVPGVNLQVLQGNYVKIDLSPFAMYRITTRWRAGLGGTRRLAFGKNLNFIDNNVTFGFRSMTDFNVWSGFHVHAEYELIHTTPFNPALQSYDPTLPQRWVPGLYGGLLKRYRISKNVYGNFQVLYNFLYKYNGLYENKVNIRFGFEFPLKKKKKSS